MALPKFSFNVISQEEYDARRKEEAVAATTAALSAKPPRRFSVAIGVPGVIPKIKKKSASLVSNQPVEPDFTLPSVPNAQVTIPVFAILRGPAILFSSLMLLFLQASHSGIPSSSSSSSSSQLSDFSATSASDFNMSRVMHNLECLRASHKTLQSRIDNVMEWKRGIRPVLAELLEHQRNSALSVQALNKELQALQSTLAGIAEVLQTTPSDLCTDHDA
jgi:hypothetical protein